jgi:serine/threonine protein phosphatase 1
LSARTLVIGDIHGCDRALETLLAKLDIQPADTFVVLGDIVDRGLGTRQVIEQLLELKKRCQLVYIKGNHEETMLDALLGGQLRELWLMHGGLEAIASYGSEREIPESHLRFMEDSLDYWETDSAIYVHANLEPAVELPKQNSDWLRWRKLAGNEPKHPSGRTVYCGHTPQPEGIPLEFPGWVCLDTYAYGGQSLTCLDVDSKILYQAKQTREYRESSLAQ